MKALRQIFYFWLSFSMAISLGWAAEDQKEKNEAQEEFSETKHKVIINGHPINYNAVAGNLILKNDKSQPKASLFFVSYTKEDENGNNEKRPVTFCFNGGPGSSSVWLHLGLLGPKRVYLNENGDALPPYHLVDNEFSLLDVTDLVFIDPISTGYSNAIPAEDEKKFHGLQEDIRTMAEFINLYMTRFNRWESPKFIIGESYGTTRAAGLAGYLHDNDMVYINGIVLVSSVLNFQSIDFNVGNDLPYLLFLPSYTAAAWYHKKLEPQLQADFLQTLNAVKHFVSNDYSKALFKGDLLPEGEKKEIVRKLARFTGLSSEYIERSNLRISMMRFAKELLRNQKRTIGRFDSRFTGIDSEAVGDYPDYDPSQEIVFGAFTAVFNYYVQNDLKWKKDAQYKILTNVQPWDYGCANQYLNVADTLRSVMTKNPYLNVFVANGYYDLATPFFATEYTFHHLGLDPSLMKHIHMKHYDAGHMMFIYRPALIKMKNDLAQFYRETLEYQEVKNNAIER